MLNDEAGNYSTSFSILSELIQRGYQGVYTTYGLRLIFPTGYEEMIRKYATQEGIDPIVILSLIKQESAFDTTVTSWAGAMGLMQLMPATASQTDSEVEPSDLSSPEINIRVGIKYFHQLLNRFNGNIVFALASYNAGPNAVDRWIRENSPSRGILEFIEMIPYRETRDYVSSIIRNYFWYSKKLGNDPPKNLDIFWKKNEG